VPADHQGVDDIRETVSDFLELAAGELGIGRAYTVLA
jgi:hypothetical protein